jgi:gliding motility-associated lipoprotein GldH
VSIPGSAWSSSYRPEFRFEVDDTTSAYQLFFLIRHTDAYPFNNIWLRMDVKAPGDTAFSQNRMEVPLAERAGPHAGKWIGRGIGEIYEQRIPLTNALSPTLFYKKGTYTVRLTQDMRTDPLPEVIQVGILLEKTAHVVRNRQAAPAR